MELVVTIPNAFESQLSEPEFLKGFEDGYFNFAQFFVTRVSNDDLVSLIRSRVSMLWISSRVSLGPEACIEF